VRSRFVLDGPSELDDVVTPVLGGLEAARTSPLARLSSVTKTLS
jgi:hypothetical protein